MSDKRRILEVVWEDSTAAHAWLTEEEEEAVTPSLVRSVGFVTLDDDVGIRLTESVCKPVLAGSKRAPYGCITMIPRSAVRKVTELTRKR